MITIFPTYKSDTATVYDQKEVPEGQSAIVKVPGDVGAISLSVHAAKPCKYSIYVTLAKESDVIADNEAVDWHPTVYSNMTDDMLAVLSGVVGCYKIASIQGNLDVKCRGK